MKELQQIVNDKVLKMVEDGSIEKAIEDGVSGAILRAIKDQFRSYGDITKQIEKSIGEGLAVNVKDLPFETYNEQMLVLIKTKLGDMFKGDASTKFLSEMDRVLAPAPKEMPIKEFVETIAGFWKTDDPYDADDLDDYATVEIEETNYGGFHLNMWKKKESSSSYSSRSRTEDLCLFVGKDGKIRLSHRQNYNLTCFSEHEAFVFKMYAAGTILTGTEDFDPDDCDLTLKECEY